MGKIPVTPPPYDSGRPDTSGALRPFDRSEPSSVQPSPLTEPVAIVGIACRFPGADDPAAFWRLLAEGRDTSREAPPDRFPGLTPRPRGHFLDRVPYGVDDRLFRLSPEEIRSLDPQQRLLLELAWEAFEDAGIPASSIAGSRTGVFVGIEKADYARSGLWSDDPARITPYTATGLALSAAAGRLSYVFDLQGPCASLDAACASSLVALDQACWSLRRGACEVALAGAVSLMLAAEPFMALSRLGALSPDGRCKTFAATANGYARGEGGAVLVLKPLSAALAAGDRIHGLVLGSAVRHGGRSNGLTAPNQHSQEAVIRDALAAAQVAPADVDYLEAHGTGTPLGDPIEMAALESVFLRGRRTPLTVASVKTNIGHLETAAGMAGVLKVLLSLRHESLPPHLHFDDPSPHVPWSSLPVRVPVSPTGWRRDAAHRRIAGVSAFGFTGTVAHVVLAEPPLPAPAPAAALPDRPLHVVTLSGRTEAALAANIAALAEAVTPDTSIADLAWSANTTRGALEHRAAALVADAADLVAELQSAQTDGPKLWRGAIRGSDVTERIGFAFTGQGSQYSGMGRALYETAPVFRAELDRCDALLRDELDHRLLDLLFGAPTDPDPLDDTANAQPALFALGVALAAWWRSTGIAPALVLGHSVGELVAAHVAGVFSLADGLRLIAARGRLVRAHAAPGGMAVAFAPWPRIEPLLRAAGIDPRQDVVPAAFNAPSVTSLAGSHGALNRALGVLAEAGVRTRTLTVSHAFHSPLLGPVLPHFRRVAEHVRYATPTLPIVSGVTGGIADPAAIVTPEYWCRHLLEPVRFADMVATVGTAALDSVVELGPAAVLSGLAQQCGTGETPWLPSLSGPGQDWPTLLATLARLHVRGAAIDWRGLDQGRTRRRVELPTYRFQRRFDALGPTAAAASTPIQLTASAVAEGFAATTRLARTLLRNAMADLGLFDSLSDAPSVEALQARLGVVPAYSRLFAYLIDILGRDGALRVAEGRVTASPTPAESADPAAIVARFPDLASMVRLLTTCLDGYPAVLRGTRNPIEVLFPAGRLDLVESVYQTGRIADFFNRGVARTVLAAAQRAAAGGTVRLLEIGAGTGGTTQAVLPDLAAAGIALEYDFTDVSAAFVRQAQARFGARYPFLRFAELDIERPPAAQGFTPGAYDVVIAANVLHATRSIAATLDAAVGLLRPGGLLVLNEVTRPHEFIGMTFGLTPGWWVYADAPLRAPHSPVLSLAGWRDALAAAGMGSVEALGLDGDDMDNPLQAVIFAHRESAAVATAADDGATIRDRLAALVERISGIAIGPHDGQTNLFELGLDSLLLMQVKQGIQSEFGVEVEMGQFYERLSTPVRLAGFIAEHGARRGAVERPAAVVAPVAGAAVPVMPPPAADAAPPPAAAPNPPMAHAGITHLLEQQLEVMKQQLSLLAGHAAPAVAPLAASPLAVAPLAVGPPAPPVAAPAVVQPPAPAPAIARGPASAGLSPSQSAFLAALIDRYTARTARSKAYAERARPVLGDWITTVGFRPELKEAIYPIVSVSSQGSHIRDLDGNDYIDMAMGFGVGFFGHRPPFVVEALRERLERGFELATQSDLAEENARLVHELTGCERVVFSNTGTEAVMTAFRLARTVTGRRRIVHFKSAFHGFYDGVMAYGAAAGATPMVPGIVQSQVDDVLVLEYGSEAALRTIAAEADTLAGVLVEPVQSRNPDLQPREFLHALRQITEAHGIALIFDELINGFRIHPGGAQAHFGVRADIVTYGKMVGGGMPVSLIAGKARFIDAIDGGQWRYGDASRPNATMTFFGGTFCRHPLSMAATNACLRYMAEQGPALQAGMNQRTSALAERLNGVFQAAAVPFRVAWFSSQFQVRHAVPGGETFQSLELAVFFFLLLEKGIYTWERRICFLSIAHTDADLDEVVAAAAAAVQEMRQAGFFGGPPPGGGRRGTALTVTQPAARPLVEAAEAAPFAVVAADRRVPLTPGQRDLAFRAGQGAAASTAFAEPVVLELTGPLDAGALQQALDGVVARHDALRITHVDETAAEIAASLSVPIVRQRVEDLPAPLADDDAAGWLAAICRTPFDLSAGPLLRAHLLTLAPDRSRLVLVLHHIVSDGWSAGVVLQELARLYAALADGQAPAVLPPAVPLADYNAWYARRLAERGAQAAAFWQERLAGLVPLALPTDRLRPPRSRGIGRRLRQALGAEDTAALTAFCRRNRCSGFMALLAAWQALLARLSGQRQVVLAIAGAGQAAMGVERLVGQCATMLPLGVEVAPDLGFAALVDRLKADLLTVWDHQDLRPEDVPGDLALPPLRVAFNQDRDPGGWQFGRVSVRLAAAPIGFVKYELFLNAIETGSSLYLDLDYDAELFGAATAAAWLEAYVRLLRAALAAPDAPLVSLGVADAAPCFASVPRSAPGVLARIAEHAAAAPNRPALVRDGMAMTYAELWDRLAHGRGIPVARRWIAAFAGMDEAGVGGVSAAAFAGHVETLIQAIGIASNDVVRISDAAMTLAGLDIWAAPLAAGAIVTAGDGGPAPTIAVLAPWEALDPPDASMLLLVAGPTLLERTAQRIGRAYPDRRMFLAIQPEGLAVALGVQVLPTAEDSWRPVGLRQVSPALNARVLDQNGNPTVLGAAGTLHLGDWNTGVAARQRADGALELTGTPDTVTEAVLLAHPSVRQAVVERHDGALRVRVAVADSAVDAATLRRFLFRHLPPDRLPAAFAAAPCLPPPDTAAWDSGVAPAGADQSEAAALATLFRAVLRCGEVGPDDDFFDLGGDSLAATQLVNRLRSQRGIELPLRAIFEAPTPARLAARLVRRTEPDLALAPGSRPAVLPLSAAQHRLWFLQQLAPGGDAYVMTVALRIEGALDPAILAAALTDVVVRHESLRTRFPLYGDAPYQEILPAAAVRLDLAVTETTEAGFAAALASPAVFDLATDIPLRARLYRLGTAAHGLVLWIHHIAGDAWSLLPFARDLRLAYAARLVGQPPAFTPLPLQYADFALWQGARSLADQEAFWRDTLADLPAALDLPYDHPRGDASGCRPAGQAGFTLPPALVDRLRDLAQETRASLFMVLQAGLATLLLRYGAGEDIPLGVPVAGRTRGELEGLVGCFVNTLVLRCRLDSRPTFRTLLTRLREADLAAFAHQDLPFERLVQLLRPGRTSAETPLFQVMLMLDQAEDQAVSLPGLITRVIAHPPVEAKFDLTFGLTETPDGALAGLLEYDAGRFRPDTAARLTRHLVALLDAATLRPDAPVQHLDFLSRTEREELLAVSTGPVLPVPDTTLTDLLAAQAARTPDALAVVAADGRTLTYAELHAAAARVSRVLTARDVGPGDLVAVACPRSPEMVIGILAALRAGAAYLPLDPGYPPARLAFILDDARPALVLTVAGVAERLPAHAALRLDALPDDVPGPLPRPATPDAPAYVIYTSGSTGQPKGAVLPHRAVVSYLTWAKAAYRPEDGCGAPINTSIGFDATVTSLFLPLISGQAVHLVAETEEIEALAECLAQQRGFSLVKLTPAHLDILQQLLPPETLAGQARALVIGGEQLSAATVRFWRRYAPATRLINEYGPTETTVGCVVHEVGADTPDEGAVPIGRPIANTRILLLDADRQLVPPGAVGEIYIGGAGVAAGYLNRPELTAERFLPDPFGPPSARIYRSGDLARRWPDGTLVYLGRADTQIKLRGYRIEPGEVEAALLAMPGVAQAAVVLRRDAAGDGELVACLVAKDGAEPPSGQTLREALSSVLPAPLVPTAFVWLDRLPLSPNGKVDRGRLLADLAPTSPFETHSAPSGGTLEATLCDVFTRFLGHPAEPDEDFFQAGGHSLLAARLVNHLRGRGLHLSLGDLFAAPTPRGLATRVTQPDTRDPGPVAVPDALDHPLSAGQRRLWVLDRLTPGSAVYNMTGAFRIAGPIDADRLHRAFGLLMQRHESLRTAIVVRDGEPRQAIGPAGDPPVSIEDVPSETAALAIAGEEALRPFDLTAAPLWRARLLRLGPADSVLVCNMHHVISDGWSLGVLVRELSAFYESPEAGTLPPLPIQYRDCAAWQDGLLRAPAAIAEVAWWKDRLAGATEPLDLPTDRPRGRGTSGRGAQVSRRLDPTVTAGIARLANTAGSTPLAVHLALVAAVLHRYTGATDLVLGTVTAGRDHPALEDQIGFFANTLPLRHRLDGAMRFDALIDATAAELQAALSHAGTPFERIVEALGIAREPGRTPLLDVVVASEAALPPLHLGEAAVVPVTLPVQTRHFDLVLFFREDAAGSALSVEYDSDLFDPWRIEALADHLTTFAANAVADAARPLRDIDLLPPAERQRLEVTWNATATRYPRDTGIVPLFREQARQRPDAVAVIGDGAGSLTYAELDRASDALAGRLAEQGAVQAGDLVGIAALRSPALIIGIIAILKAGAAYVPIDPAYPPSRVAAMFGVVPIRCLLSDGSMAQPPATCPMLPLEAPDAGDIALPDRAAGADDLAYVMFTSGTTGIPKAVAIPQRAVVRLVRDTNFVSLGPDERLLLTGSISFDAATFEIWGMLLNGGTLVLAGTHDLLNPATMRRLLAEHRIGTMWLTSSLFNQMVDSDPSMFAPLRQLLIGGERLSPPHVAAILQAFPALRLLNGYGPTENTTFSLVHPIDRVEPGRDIPIGRPIANSRVYVLGPGDRSAPVGVLGEICVAGDGLARGYFGREDLTAARFVAHPTIPHERLYRTGDFGCWLPDGTVAYQGRRDRQVKIRGVRIEIGEVEAALLAQPGVARTAVVARNRDGSSELLAYVMGERPDPAAIRTGLRERLPQACVPAHIIVVDRLPLDPNGKLDVAALPEPDSTPAAPPDRSAANPVEAALARIWADVLGRVQVGTGENFFDLGGHSLLAIRLVHRVNEELGLDVTPADIFMAPTVAQLADQVLAAMLTARRKPAATAIPALPAASDYPLSATQQRLWFLHRLAGGLSAYNIVGAWRLRGRIDLPALRRTFAALAERHEALRTVCVTRDGEARQVILAELPPLPEERALPDPAEVEAVYRELGGTVFDLAGPLLRATLLRLGADDAVLVIVCHHMIADGWSAQVIGQDLAALYAGATLAPAVAFKDAAAWLVHRHRQSEDADRAYWQARLAGPLPLLDLPTDRPRGPQADRTAGVVRVSLDPPVVAGLRCLGAERRVSLFPVLVAMVKVLLHRLTGQSDILVGTPVAHRDDPALAQVVGFLADTVVLRDTLAPEAGFADALDSVAATVAEAMAHAALPFDAVVALAGGARDPTRSPLFDVMVTLATPAPPLALPHIEATPIACDDPGAQFDLTFRFIDGEDGLGLEIVYAAALFAPETVARMARQLGRLATAAVADPNRTIAALPLLDAAEARQVQQDFAETRVDFGPPSNLVAQFEAQVDRTPDRIALVGADISLTYRGLDEAANALAAALLVRGLAAEERVGLAFGASPQAVIGMLGIIKAGGAYVPLDPSQAGNRLRDIVADAGCRFVVAAAPGPFPPDTLVGLPQTPRAERPGVAIAPDRLAYVIFTSGSTGRPKGVMVEHRSVLNLVHSIHQAVFAPLAAEAPLQVAQFAAPVFDASVQQIFPALLGGHTLHPVPSHLRQDARALLRMLAERRIAVADGTPTLYDLLLDAGWQTAPLGALRHLVIGGEVLRGDVVRRLRANPTLRGLTISNAYGPTECTVDVALHTLPPDVPEPEVVPIGRPLPNVQALVLDAAGGPVPIGVPGELYLSGPHLARGYLGADPAEAFLPHPQRPGERLYRTGDRVCWAADGTLRYLGRTDGQLKIRGHRIEPGDVEAALLRVPGVRQAAVMGHGAGASAVLLAWLAADAPVEPTWLRRQLAERLPDWMIPSLVRTLPALPQTSSGKLDRQALAALPVGDDAAPQEPPQSALETKVAAICRDVLGGREIGRLQNFFMAGGHSLGALRVLARIEAALGVTVPVQAFYRTPTIADLASLIEASGQANRTGSPSLPPADIAETDPLSPAQHRLWVIAELRPDAVGYAMPAAFRLDGPLDVAALARAASALVGRHEALRTVFTLVAGEPRQRVLPPAPAALQPEAVPDLAAAEAVVAAEASRPFDLEAEPPLRIRLLRAGTDRHVLLVNLHHIIGDGLSLAIMARELSRLYDAFAQGAPDPLPPLPLHYRDAVAAMAARRTSPAAQAARTWWLDQFAAPPPPLPLPIDQPRLSDPPGPGAATTVSLTAAAADTLRGLAGTHGTTLFTLVLALVARLLQQETGTADMVIGIPVAGRFHPDLEPLVGLFAETCPLRLSAPPDEPLPPLLARVGAALQGALSHDAFGFDQLVEALDLPAHPGRAALFDVMVAWQAAETTAFQPHGLAVSAVPVPVPGAQFDLCFSFLDRGDGLDLTLVYRADLYRPGTAARLARGFLALAEAAGAGDAPTTLNRLRRLWAGVLGRTDIGDDAHFLESGGQSLKAARLVSRIHAEFGCTLRLREVFAHPTLRAQAALIDRAMGTTPEPATPALPAATELLVPASAGQRRLWVLSQLAADPAVYAITATLDLDGPLDTPALARAVDRLVGRHEVLRTRLVAGGAGTLSVQQRILPPADSGIALEIGGGPEPLVLSLDGGPLFRVRLTAICPDRHRLEIVLHHAIGDGWSIGVLARDLGELYRSVRRGEPPALPDLSVQYRDFAARQEAWLASADGAAARAWWLDVLAGDLPVLDLPADAPRPAVQTFRGALHRFTLDRSCAAAARSLAMRHGTTLFGVLLGGVNALLHRYTGAADIILGMPVAGRDAPDLEDQVGLYINTVPLRCRFDPTAGFAALVAQVGEALAGALDHQSYPFDRLVDDLAVPRDPSRSPLFDVLVVAQDEAATPPRLEGLTVREVDADGTIAKLDLSFHLRDTPDGIDVWLEYNTDLFTTERMRRLGQHFGALLRSALDQPGRPLGMLDMLPPAEAEALRRWATPLPAAAATTVLAAFADNVASRPTREAVRCGTQRLDYRGLDAWANGIAARLAALGLRIGDRVAVALPRSAALPAAILGIWKAGLVYVPLDPAYPAARLAFILEDAGCLAVIGSLADVPLPAIDPDAAEPADAAPVTPPGADDAAYVIYTSGSTGTPKGVAIAHRNLAAFAPVLRTTFGLTDGDVVFALTTPSFDISLLELVCPLAEGLSLAIADDAAVADPAATLTALRTSGATVLQVTPSRLAVLLHRGADLGAVRTLLVGGERLPPELAAAIRTLPGIRPFNVYGPTETTIWSSCAPITDTPPSIGWALPGETLLIRGSAGQEQPVGIPGEIVIGGVGVGLGYRGRDALTAERFVTEGGARLYRTGDRGVRLADGSVAFLGRQDDQVKLHGFRIEPGEIEAALTTHPAVQQAAVTVQELSGGPELVGYVAAPDLAIPGEGETALRAHLLARLPRHMVPMLLVGLPGLPLLPSGKVDRKALPVPAVSPSAAPEVLADPLAATVLRLWRDVLVRPDAGMEADFFALGGHSLRAADLAGRLSAALGLEVGLRDVFLHPTPGRLAAEVAHRRATALPPLVSTPVATDYPLSHTQQRLFAMSALQSDPAACTIAGSVEITGPLDPSALTRAFGAVMDRHEALRTGFRLIEGVPRQEVAAASPFDLPCLDLSAEPDPATAAQAATDALAQTPFDLATPPLLRAHLLRFGAARHVLGFALHHIIADGWSLGLLLDDLERAYRAALAGLPDLPPALFQYRDHVAREQAIRTSAHWERSRTWWRAHLAGPLPVLDLPIAQPRPRTPSGRGGQVPFDTPPELAAAIEALARRNGATPFMVLLAAWAALFHRLTGDEDLILGSVSSNRDVPALAEVVGCFVNPLPLRLRPDSRQGFAALLEAVRATVLGALDHAAYPFDLLVRELRAGGDPGRSPLFDVGFSWNALPHMGRRHFADCTLAPFGSAPVVAKYDLLIIAGSESEGIGGVIEYAADLFAAADVAGLVDQFTAILKQVTADSDVVLMDLRLGSAAPPRPAPAALAIELQF
jgi:amino acid adenylation domain-containing protein